MEGRRLVAIEVRSQDDFHCAGSGLWAYWLRQSPESEILGRCWSERGISQQLSFRKALPLVESDVSALIYRAPIRTDIMRSLDANVEIIGVFWCGDTKMAAYAAGVRNMHSTDCH